MKNTKSNLAGIALCSLFTAVICILSQIFVPTPTGVPVTLQLFAVSLCGYLLGMKKALISVAGYILLGLIGIPVFSGFKGGVHNLFSLTGGFIFGFLFVALFCGIAKNTRKTYLKIILSAAGVVLCHIFGTVQLALVSKSGLVSAFLTASLPFILKDFLFCAVAYFIAKAVNKRFKAYDI